MSSAGKCRECGGLIPPGGPAGLCPKCLLTLAIEQMQGPTAPDADDADAQPGLKHAAGNSPETPPPQSSLHELSGPPAPTEKPGDKIGPYKLIEEIGQGGFGVVYMAEQSEPVKRRVALKIIKLGMDTKQVVARFESERQALALMEHPNIAKILEAGATETGRPYFVMELVQGLKITDYCDQHHLSTKERLDLFVQICRAVQHAHQKGVIHRDLKPSNILVGVQDGEPVPKIIDFGIAKATQQELTEQTVFTQFGHFIGTPAYMSPEQAQLDGVDVDTRSDIYSLGVLLYELLTGRTPFETKQLLKAGLEEMRRMIREKEPTRPSTRLRTMQEADLTTTAQRRGAEPPKLLKLVRGDLDWIVMKCLEKDRSRRYETANGLAMDIERHLSQEPVVARPPKTAYRVQKFVQRNKFLVSAASTVLALLILEVVGSIWWSVRTAAAHRDATEKLWSSYVAQAHALRLSGEAGRHFESLATLRKAAAIRPSVALRDEALLVARNEAIASMILPDIRWLVRKDFTKTGEKICLDSTFKRYAVCDRTGAVIVRRVTDDREEVRLPTAVSAAKGAGGFSPDGKFLAVSYADGHYRVWDWSKPAIVLEVGFVAGCAFAPDSRTFAVWDTNATNIVFHDLMSGVQLRSISLGDLGLQGWRGYFAFEPTGQSRALFSTEANTNVVILDMCTGRTLKTLQHPANVWAAVWHPDGKHLATGCDDQNIRIWDSTSGAQLRVWRADRADPISLVFNHRGNVLASSGWLGYTCLWDFASGRELVSIYKSGHAVFSADDVRLATDGWEGKLLDFFEVTAGHGLRTVFEAAERSGKGGHGMVADSTGRLLVVGTPEGVGLFDFQNGQQISSAKFEGPKGLIGFDEESQNVIVTGREGFFRCPIIRSGPEGRLSIGQAVLVSTECANPVAGWGGRMSANGKVCAATDGNQCQVFRTDTFEKRAETGIQPGMRYGDINFDGSLFASGVWQHPGVKVWNTQTGAPVKELATRLETATVAFSPDGHYLVTGINDEYCFWEVGSWSVVRRIAQEPGNDFAPMMAFSRDGKIFAGTHSRNKIRLHDAATGQVLADLGAPNSGMISGLVFNREGTLLAADESGDAVRLWDLRRIRQQLAELSLDWPEPPYPPAEADPTAAAGQSQPNNRRP